MKTIKFRPLRVIKKTGKIVVASYMQWNNIRCGNYSKFNLIVDNEYEQMNKSDFVYNHEGKQLYHFNYNPWEVFEYYGSCIAEGFDWDYMRETYKDFILVSTDREGKQYKSYHIRGADCAGTPSFTHYDEDRITTDDTWNYYGADAFEAVTVGYVITWLGWFLYQLENSNLKVGR